MLPQQETHKESTEASLTCIVAIDENSMMSSSLSLSMAVSIQAKKKKSWLVVPVAVSAGCLTMTKKRK